MGGSFVSEEMKKRVIEVESMLFFNSIYFAHPINYYMGSKFNVHEDKEVELIGFINKKFPEYNVFNPNQEFNQDNYVLWKRETGNGMNYYFDVILPKMEAGVGLSFDDGMFGAGVYGEIERLMVSGKPVFESREDGVIISLDCLEQDRRLSVKDTQKRVYNNG